MRIYIFLVGFLFSFVSTSQVLTIAVSENHFGIDELNSLIVSHLKDLETYTNTSDFDQIQLSLNQEIYSFNSAPFSLEYSKSYLITNTNNSNQYRLYFTPLPIILVASADTIVNEPKVLAHFIYSDKEQVLVSNIGIEIRGGSSQTYPKKTYDLEFWNDEIGADTKNVQFGELRLDDDWILDALYNEPLRLRSYVANKIWLQMHTPNYLSEEPNAKAGANVKYVEMFVNHQYNGIYNLSEQIDPKQLKLVKFNNTMSGELYKGISWGATTFTALPNYNNELRQWSGYEFKHPKEEEVTRWQNLHQFTDFVMNSADIDFTRTIWSKFDLKNYLDYFLFLNLIRASDNTGKNIYLAKYKTNEPYFYVPWDLDGCFGTLWNGTNENTTNDFLMNGFFNRVLSLNPNNIATSIVNKWREYRNTIFTNTALTDTILAHYNFLKNNKMYEREALVYPNYSYSQEDLSYMLQWLENRLAYLDHYFDSKLSSQQHHVYPNPAQDKIYLIDIISLVGKEYKIYNTLGRLTSTGFINSNFIPVENLEIGYYIIRVAHNSYQFMKY